MSERRYSDGLQWQQLRDGPLAGYASSPDGPPRRSLGTAERYSVGHQGHAVRTSRPHRLEDDRYAGLCDSEGLHARPPCQDCHRSERVHAPVERDPLRADPDRSLFGVDSPASRFLAWADAPNAVARVILYGLALGVLLMSVWSRAQYFMGQ